MTSRVARLRAYWAELLNELSGPVRAVASWLLAAGALLLLVGVVLDLGGVMVRYPFAVNMLSTVTAACFGVPAALIAIRRLQVSQEALSRKRDVAKLAATTANWIFNMADGCIANRDSYKLAYSRLKSIEQELTADPAHLSPGSLRKIATAVRKGLRHFHDAVGDEEALRQRSLVINNRWGYLLDHLRPALYETGSHWIYPELKSQFLREFNEEVYLEAMRFGLLPAPLAAMAPSMRSRALAVADSMDEAAKVMADTGEGNVTELADMAQELSSICRSYRDACESQAILVLYLRGVRDSLARNLLPEAREARGDPEGR